MVNLGESKTVLSVTITQCHTDAILDTRTIPLRVLVTEFTMAEIQNGNAPEGSLIVCGVTANNIDDVPETVDCPGGVNGQFVFVVLSNSGQLAISDVVVNVAFTTPAPTPAPTPTPTTQQESGK